MAALSPTQSLQPLCVGFGWKGKMEEGENMPQKRTHKGAQIIAIIIAILLLCVAGFCAYLLIDNQQQKAEQKETVCNHSRKSRRSGKRIGRLRAN